MEDLFRSLVQVSLGKRNSLQRVPSEDEWYELFHMASDQAMIGICFGGICRLYDHRSGLNVRDYYESLNLSRPAYFEWMSMSVKIQDVNAEVKARCVDLSRRFADDNLEYYILKGPSIAALYGPLGDFRQSGDIDVWVPGPQDALMRYAEKQSGKMLAWDYSHVDCKFFDDVDVELHYRPSFMYNVFSNRWLQRYFERCGTKGFEDTFNVNGVPVRTVSYEFNILFVLLHIYKHLFNEGVGLRQVMDYYFVLASRVPDETIKAQWLSDVRSLRIGRFASAVMWVMKDWFGLDDDHLLCCADEREGRFLISEIMCAGNFGQHDKRDRKAGRNYHIREFKYRIKHLWHLAGHYPQEFFWSPFWLVWHWAWKRTYRY